MLKETTDVSSIDVSWQFYWQLHLVCTQFPLFSSSLQTAYSIYVIIL
jgi:hypothetical protein